MDRSSIIKCVIFIQIVSVLLGIFLSLAGDKVCNTGKCVSLSRDILRVMKTSADPCDDFYDFSCGNYQEHNDILARGTFELIERLTNMLTEPPRRGEPRFVRLRKDIMKQCLDDGDMDKMIENLKSMIELVGFPTVHTDWWQRKESGWTFENAIKSFRHAGLYTNVIMDINANISPFGSNRIILMSANPKLVLSLCDEDCQAKLYVKIAVALGANTNTAAEDIKEIIDMEKTLLNAIFTENMTTLNDYDRSCFRSYNAFVASFDFLDWNTYFTGSLGRLPEDLNDNEFILLLNEKFLGFLQVSFKDFSKKAIANYMIWHNLMLGYTYIPGTKWPRMYCEKLKDDLGPTLSPISNYLALNMMDKTDYSTVKKLVSLLKNKLLLTIDNLRWMDQATKKKAKLKVSKMGSVIGYLDQFLDSEAIEEFYKDLSIGSNFLQTLLNLKKFDTHITIDICYFGSMKSEKCRLYLESMHYPMDQVNAFYNPLKNLICIPEPILKPPIFDPGVPEFLNYGKIGAIIGHEIIHGFDSTGAQYDEEGNKHDWWQPVTKQKFLEKTKCFVDHFSSFGMKIGTETFKIDGNLTLTENIADAGGLNLAFQAYRDLVDARIYPIMQLPNIDYTPEQLFLIGYAQIYCHGEYFSNETFYLMDSHAPDPIRIKVGLQNFPFLGEIFNCNYDDEMNPSKKCKIW